MEIKINLDGIFGSSQSEETLENSVRSSHPSHFEASHSQQSQPGKKYRVDVNLFDDSSQEARDTTHKASMNKNVSVVTSQADFGERNPGERLYYESLNYMTKKKKEIERIRLEQLAEQQKQATFKPKINKNTQKILQNKKPQPLSHKKSKEYLPTYIIKQQQEIIQCTFKPELTAKPIMSSARPKEKEKLFEQLYNDHKRKQVRIKMKTQQSYQTPKAKKLSKEEFQGFLNRNKQFMNKVQRKNEKILTTSTKFDLQTGHKLFSPKTNTVKSHSSYFHSREEPGPSKQQGIQPKPIFAKNYASIEDYQQDYPLARRAPQFRHSEQQCESMFEEISQARQHQEEEVQGDDDGVGQHVQTEGSPQWEGEQGQGGGECEDRSDQVDEEQGVGYVSSFEARPGLKDGYEGVIGQDDVHGEIELYEQEAGKCGSEPELTEVEKQSSLRDFSPNQ